MWVYTLFPQILNMSLTASIVIVFVLLARLLLKKTPKIFSYALWAVVLFRLLCPVSISSEWSLLKVLDVPFSQTGSIEYIPTDIVHTENPQVTVPVPGISEAINDNLPQGEEQLAADPLEAPMAVATLVWLVGMLTLLLHSIISLIKLRRKLIGAVHLRDNVYLADHIVSPFVMGLLRPKIYLPSTLTEQEQTYIIQHEQHHIRRFDPAIKILAFAALCVHWFNPLVWLAFVLSGKDMEMSCDEAVMKKMGNDIRAEYSTSLLCLATGRKIFAGSPLAFGEGNTKSRIKNVMKYKKPAIGVIMIAFVSCIIMAVCFLTNPDEEQDLSFLNYNNLVSSAAQREQLPVHVSTQSGENDYAIDGGDLGKYLDNVNWSPQKGISRSAQRDTEQNSTSSIQIQFSDGLWLKIFDIDTAYIYSSGQERYYRGQEGDYTKALSLLKPAVASEFSENRPTSKPLSGIPKTYPAEDAIADGNYVSLIDSIHNEEVMVEFINKVNAKEPAFVRTVTYTREGDPIISDFSFDGKVFAVTTDNTRDNFGNPQILDKNYNNLVTYEQSDRIYYVVTNLAEITQEQQHNGFDGVVLKYDVLNLEPEKSRPLTQSEIDKVNIAFEPIIPIEHEEYEHMVNPVCFFFGSSYEKPEDMDFTQFIWYFATEDMLERAEMSEKEFQLLKELDNFPFDEVQSLSDMPVPIQRKPLKEVNKVLEQYMGITASDLNTEEIPYLNEPYNAFYTYTSDAGFMGFYCTGGETEGDIVRLFSDYATLTLEKKDGRYLIVAHVTTQELPQ